MSIPNPSNSILNIDDLKLYTTATDRESVEVLGYYSENDGGGGVFYWDASSSEPDLYGMVVEAPGADGRWIRVFDNTIDVKWFGAHESQTAAVNNVRFQAALDYIKLYVGPPATRRDFNLFISKGQYRLSAPLVLTISNIAHPGRVILSGAGTQETELLYTASTGTVLTVRAHYRQIIEIRDFKILGSIDPNTATGLMLDSMAHLQLRNIDIQVFNTGLFLRNIFDAQFTNLHIAACVKAVYGVKGNDSAPAINPNPNMLQFSSCVFDANRVVAVELKHLHSVSFISCDFSANGAHNTPALAEAAAIKCTYIGADGANGLNVINCYFEANIGIADILLNSQGFGTHTFQGNTFNRNFNLNGDGDPIYTINNILVIGNGQEKPLFSRSMCKLVFEGNGFFVIQPYVADATRKAIKIDYAPNPMNYWEFDIVEQGNVYMGAAGGDAPEFGGPFPPQLAESRLTPQVSEFTRVKAFGSFLGDVEIEPGVWITNVSECAYNIITAWKIATGTYEVLFANELERLPVIVATCVNREGAAYCFPWIDRKSTTGFVLKTVGLGGELTDCRFDFHVF